MSYDITWLVEKRVVYVAFKGNVTQADMERFVTEVTEKVQSGIPLVHLMTNSLEMGKVEISLATLQTLARGFSLTRQIGWAVDINRSPINKMISSIASQFAGVRFRTFPTYEDAIDFLKRNDTTLGELGWTKPRNNEEALQ